MKISIITSTYPRYQGDGAGSFIHSMSSHLVKLGHRVTVFAPYDPTIVPTWQSEVTVKRVRYIWPAAWSKLGHARSLSGDVRLHWHAYPLVILFSLVAIVRLAWHVTRDKADVIYAQWLVPGGFIGAIVHTLTGVPLVVSLHGSDVFVVERYGIFRALARFIFGRTKHVIACSTDLARRAIELGLPSHKATVVPYGVDSERYVPDPKIRTAIREQLAIPETQPVVMVMGRLVYKKGFSYFIQAARSVLTRFPTTQFVIAGDGDLREELENQARSLGIEKAVSFIGHVPWAQTPDYLTMADIFVVPSIIDEAGNVDGLPNVLLESMASGRPIVASHVAGIPEVLHNNENGLLVPQKDVPALVDAVCRLLDDAALRERLGHAARQTVVSRLSWVHTAGRVAGILRGGDDET